MIENIEYTDQDMKDANEEGRLIKVNLTHDHHAKNGEGVWAMIKNIEDKAKYDTGDGNFFVVLCNQPLTQNLLIGDVIKVRGTGPETRPVLDHDWYGENRKR